MHIQTNEHGLVSNSELVAAMIADLWNTSADLSPRREAVAEAIAFALSGQCYWDETGCVEDLDFDDAVDAVTNAVLSALTPLDAPVWRTMESAPKSKPLVWSDWKEGGTVGRPKDYQYFITSNEDESVFFCHWSGMQYGDLETAKHAAQVDYDGPTEQTGNPVAEAVQEIIDQVYSTYKARNGREVGIEDDNGEKVWLLPDDAYQALRALSSLTQGGE
jgi:hypothetical protein